MDKRYRLVKKLTVYLLFFIVGIYGLIKAQAFLAPLFLAILFSYLLYPIADFLEKHGFPRIVANLIAIFTGLGVVAGIIFFFIEQFSVFAEDYPQMQEQAMKNLQSLERWISSTFNVPEEQVRLWIEERIASLSNSGGTVKTAFKITTNTILWIGLMPVYVFFMLYYRSKIYEFLLRLAPNDEQERSKDILNKVNLVAKKYMTGVFIVVLILSVLHSIGLSLVGLDYPVLLGVTAALCNFIPFFGTLIGAVFPLLYSLLAMDSLNYSLWVVIYFLIIQFTENNILTPNITGGAVRLNPFVTILSLILGSMVWGVWGMFMIVPFMAMFRIFCEHVSFLKPIAFLLSNRGTEKYALSWDKVKKAFKKN